MVELSSEIDRAMPLLAGGLLFVLIFLVTRRLWLWYWKVEEAIGLLRKIEANTRPRT